MIKILVTISVVCLVFGFWGYFTKTGAGYFDEMSGMIPFFALIFGAGLLIMSGLLWFFVKRRMK